MGFFERPDREDQDTLDEGDGPEFEDSPMACLGGVVPVEALIARTDEGAVGVRSLVVYPDGFEVTVVAWRRRRPVGRKGRRDMFFGPFDLYGEDEVPDNFLRFGLEFPDGTSVTNFESSVWRGDTDQSVSTHGLDASSGTGSDLFYEQQFWAWPVPKRGTLTIVCEWPAYGIAEKRIEIDAAEIYDASRRAVPVWPAGHEPE